MLDRYIIVAGCALVLSGGSVLDRSKPTRRDKLGDKFSFTIDKLSIPTGYQRIFGSSGVQVFKNADRNDYITSIDLKQSTAINLTGKCTGAPQGKVSHRSMSQFWQDAIAKNTTQQQAQVVINIKKRQELPSA
jgi:hypothetical protein